MQERRTWTRDEDRQLQRIVFLQTGIIHWSKVSAALTNQVPYSLRTGKQCRERWYNHLSPGIKKGRWSQEQLQKFSSLLKIYGKKWTKISEEVEGRTENNVKNYFYSATRRAIRLLKSKVQKNHKNRLKLLNLEKFMQKEGELVLSNRLLQLVLGLGSQKDSSEEELNTYIKTIMKALEEDQVDSIRQDKKQPSVQSKLDFEVKVEQMEDKDKQLEELRCGKYSLGGASSPHCLSEVYQIPTNGSLPFGSQVYFEEGVRGFLLGHDF